MDVRLEWGPTGAAALAPECDVAVVVDVLTFSTTVTVAADRGVAVRPFRWADASAEDEARRLDATLARSRGEAKPGDVSLSPETFRTAGDLSRVVVPSPNGSTICAILAEAGADVVVAGLRNRRAVAAHLSARGGRVLVVPAGERWPDGSLRFAIEDLIGAGAIIAGLKGRPSPEARIAVSAYEAVRGQLLAVLEKCNSGRELIERGFGEDVRLASMLNCSEVAPVLVDGAYQRGV